MTVYNISTLAEIVSAVEQAINDWGNASEFRMEVSTYSRTIQLDISTTSTVANERDEDVKDWIDDIVMSINGLGYNAIGSKNQILINH